MNQKIKILTVIGARPQFIKAWPVSQAIAVKSNVLEEHILHTGQHYDDRMSGVFFRSLGIAEPTVNLAVGSGTHAYQTGEIMKRLEPVFETLRPDIVLVYGDTNSTLAAGLVAAKAGVRLAHVEAGLRSWRRGMAEEVNRVVVDRLSDLLFCPTAAAVENLRREGRVDGVTLTGDVMFDAFEAMRAQDPVAPEGPLTEGADYVFASIHRAETTDDPATLAGVFRGLASINSQIRVVLSLHPRTKAAMEQWGLNPGPIAVVPPLNYAETVAALLGARYVATDSGGLQKEAYFAARPCVTIREETEWVETLNGGWNRLAGLTEAGVVEAFASLCASPPTGAPAAAFGDGNAAQAVAERLATL